MCDVSPVAWRSARPRSPGAPAGRFRDRERRWRLALQERGGERSDGDAHDSPKMAAVEAQTSVLAFLDLPQPLRTGSTLGWLGARCFARHAMCLAARHGRGT